MTFNIGDVVRLKSGGPRMTIQDINDHATAGARRGVQCVWFVGTELKSGTFQSEALEYPRTPAVAANPSRIFR